MGVSFPVFGTRSSFSYHFRIIIYKKCSNRACFLWRSKSRPQFVISKSPSQRQANKLLFGSCKFENVSKQTSPDPTFIFFTCSVLMKILAVWSDFILTCCNKLAGPDRSLSSSLRFTTNLSDRRLMRHGSEKLNRRALCFHYILDEGCRSCLPVGHVRIWVVKDSSQYEPNAAGRWSKLKLDVSTLSAPGRRCSGSSGGLTLKVCVQFKPTSTKAVKINSNDSGFKNKGVNPERLHEWGPEWLIPERQIYCLDLSRPLGWKEEEVSQFNRHVFVSVDLMTP